MHAIALVGPAFLLAVCIRAQDAAPSAADTVSRFAALVRHAEAASSTDKLADARDAVARAGELLPRLTAATADDGQALQRADDAAFRLGYVADRVADHRVSLACFEWVLAEREVRLASDDAALITAMQNVGVQRGWVGDVAGAATMARRVLAIQIDRHPADAPAVLRAKGNLASALRASGDLATARDLWTEVLAIRERTLPDDDGELTRTRIGLALVLAQLGEPASAVLLQQKVVEVLSAHEGGGLDLPIARMNLANTLLLLDRPEAAAALLRAAAERLETTLPPAHPYRLALASSLTLRDRTTRSPREVVDTTRRLLQASRQAGILDGPHFQRMVENHLEALDEVDDVDAARRTLRSLERDLERLPEDHPNRLFLSWQQALWEWRSNQGQESRGNAEEQRLRLERALPADHPLALGARREFAARLVEEDDHRAAAAIYEHDIELLAAQAAQRSSQLTLLRCGAAKARFALGEHALARHLLDGAPAPDQLDPGARFDLAATRLDIANLALEPDTAERATELIELVADDPPGSQRRQRAMALRLPSLCAAGHNREALQLARQAAVDATQRYGAAHPRTLEARSAEAAMANECGDSPEARLLAEATLTDVLTHHSPAHPLARQLGQLLANLEMERGEFDAARTRLRGIITTCEERGLAGTIAHADLRRHLCVVLTVLRDPEARALTEQAVQFLRQRLSENDPSLLDARLLLATAMEALGHPEMANQEVEEVLQLASRHYGQTSPLTLKARQHRARLWYDQGDVQRARTELEAIHATCLRLFPERVEPLNSIRQDLADAMQLLGDYVGEVAVRELVFRRADEACPGSSTWVIACELLAGALARVGEEEGALELRRRIVAAADRMQFSRRWSVSFRCGLARALIGNGERAAGRALADSLRADLLPQTSLLDRCSVAWLYVTLDDLEAPEAVIRDFAEADSLALSTLRTELLVRRGDFEGAFASKQVAVAHVARGLPVGHPDRLQHEGNLLWLAAISGRHDLVAERAPRFVHELRRRRLRATLRLRPAAQPTLPRPLARWCVRVPARWRPRMLRSARRGHRPRRRAPGPRDPLARAARAPVARQVAGRWRGR